MTGCPGCLVRAQVEQGWEQLGPAPARHHLHGYHSPPPQLPAIEAHSCAHMSQAPGWPWTAGTGGVVAGGCGHRHIRHPRRLALGHPCREGRACILEGWPWPSSRHAWRCTCSRTAREIRPQPGQSPRPSRAAGLLKGRGLSVAPTQDAGSAPAPAPQFLLQTPCVSPRSCVKSSPLCAGVRRRGLGR